MNLSQFYNVTKKLENYGSEITTTAAILNDAVLDGAIIVNASKWSNLLGYNTSFLKNSNQSMYYFYKLCQNFTSYVDDHFLFSNSSKLIEYYNEWKTQIQYVDSISGYSIFIKLSEELEIGLLHTNLMKANNPFN